MKCEICLFRNKPYAQYCKRCHTRMLNAYSTQEKAQNDFRDCIYTGDYQSCQKYLESRKTQGPAALSTSINYIYRDGLAPIHVACSKNNTAIVKLLLKYNADPNIILPWLHDADLAEKRLSNATTMHMAAMHGNLEVMKLLIENGFNFHQMNSCIDGGKTVFLILCQKGYIKCLDYIMSLRDHGNQNNNNSNNPYVVDIFASDHDGKNGLNHAVFNDDLKMCEYLLERVYNEKRLRDKIINNAVFKSAAKNPGQNCVSIFTYLVEFKQSIFDDMKLLHDVLLGGAFYSWQIVAYIVQNEDFYTKFPLSEFGKDVARLLCGDVVVTLRASRWEENYDKCVPLVWNFISMRFGDVERFECVAGLVASYCQFFDFETDFFMFVDMLELMLSRDNIKDWKYFYKSTTVMPHGVCLEVAAMLVVGTNFNKIHIDGRWKDLVLKMIIAYNDQNEWHEMSKYYNYSSDKEDINIDNKFCHCTNHHAMISFVLKKEKDEMSKECSKCNETKDNIVYWCKECNEYLCCDCVDNIELNQLLLNKQFSLFNMKIKKYNKDSPLLKKVESFLLRKNI